MAELSIGDTVNMVDVPGTAKVTAHIDHTCEYNVYTADHDGKPYRMFIPYLPYDRRLYNVESFIGLMNNAALSERVTVPVHVITAASGEPGILVEQAPEGFCSFADFMRTYRFVKKADGHGHDRVPVRFASIEKMIQCAINFTKTAELISEEGYTIENLERNSMLLNAETGDVIYDGPLDLRRIEIKMDKAPYYSRCAPEVVRGQAPDEHSQLHWLAVSLYELLIHDHPLLDGDAYGLVYTTPVTEMDLYGNRPKFMFDPNNDLDEEFKQRHRNAFRNWPQYPEYLRDAFTRVFTAGLSEPEKRLTYGEWTDVLTRLLRDFS